MRAITKTLVVLFLAFVAASPSFTRAADPLEALPADVDYLVRYASIDKFIGNASDMLAAIGPAAQKYAKDIEGNLSRELLRSSDKLDVLDRKSPVYQATFLVSGGDAPAFLVPATKKRLDPLYQALLGVDDLAKVERKDHARGFVELATDKRRCFVARRGDYVLYTFSSAAFDTLKAFDPEQREPLASALEARAKKQLDSTDIAIWVNISRLAIKYKSDIDGVRMQTLELIKSLSDEELGVPNAEGAKKLYTQLATTFFDSIHDTTWAVAGANLGPEGGAATVLFGFKKDSATDKFLVANPPSPLDNLELLPAKAAIYLGFRKSYSGLGEALLLTNYGNQPDDRKAAEAALKLLREADVQSSVSSMTIPSGGKHGMVTTTLEEAKDAAKLRRGWSAYLKALGEVKTPVMNQKFDYQANAEKHKNYSIDLFKTEFKVTTDDAEAEAILNGFLAKLFGGMSFQARLTAVEDLMVQTTGNDPRFIRQVLDSFDSGEGVLGLEKAYGKIRDRLSKKANFLMLVNGPQMVVDSVNLVKQIEPFGTLLGFTPFNFNLKPPVSYTGVSVTTEPQALRIQLFVPVEQPRGILQIFAPGI